jgi:hypothetical protein
LDFIYNFSLQDIFIQSLPQIMLSVTQIRLSAPKAPQKIAALKLKPNTPKKIKEILQHLSSPASKYFNQKILSSADLPQIMPQIDTWYTLDAFYITRG